MEEKRLKIAFFVDSYYPIIDGVTHVVDNYARILSQKHDVTVFVPKSRKKYVDNFPYRVVRCKISKISIGEYNISLPSLDQKFKDSLKNEKFDIVHVHSPFTVGRFGIEYANKNNIPVVITCHSQFYQDFKRVTGSNLVSKLLVKYVARAFNACDELWTMNPKLKELVRNYGYHGKVFIIPNGCDMDGNLEKDKISEFKSQLVEKEQKLIINVGRVYALKNIDFMLRVCKKLKEDKFNFKMLFIGDGTELEKYKKRSKKLGLEDTVAFVGVVEDREKLKYYYASADLLFFPSAYDTDGLVKSEAACFETPTIFLKDTIAASVVKDEDNGFIGENDVDKFAERLQRVFKKQEIYDKVKKRARETLFHTWQQVLQLAEREYNVVISQHPHKKTQKSRKNMEKKYKNSQKNKNKQKNA